LFSLPFRDDSGAASDLVFFADTHLYRRAWKEALIWLCAAALLVVIRRGERLPLSAIGLCTSRW
jgi:hypothetical protein